MFRNKNDDRGKGRAGSQFLKDLEREEARQRSARETVSPDRIGLSLILPVRGEAIRLGVALKRLATFLRSSPLRGEILVVDDGSQDGTELAAARWTRYFPDTIVVRHRESRGLGAAVRTGVLVSRGQYLVAIDPQLRAPLADVHRVVQCLQDGVDLVTASRNHPETEDGEPTAGFLERASETAFRALAKMIMPSSGTQAQSDLLGLRRSSARAIAQRSRVYGDAYLPEWLALAKRLGLQAESLGLSWVEEPLPVRDEAEGELSKLRELWRASRRLSKAAAVKPAAPDELLQETTFVRLERTKLPSSKGKR
jgi:hypothetical protein